MALIRSTHTLKLKYILFLVVAIGFSFVYFTKTDVEQKSELIKTHHNITIWSNDFHISPIHDLKHLLTPIGVHFIDKSLSGSCTRTHTCARDLKILSSGNGMNPNKAIRRQFYESYKNDPLMNQVDAFVCFHPAAMCEIFMPFNRTLIVIASTRYELARFSADQWNEWNQNLRIIASNPRNVVAGNNLYDAEYIKYFTGINTIVLPSMCGYTNAVYHPVDTHPEYIFMPSRSNGGFSQQFFNELNRSIKKTNTSIIVKELRQLYSNYDYKVLASHPGIIYLPYQVSTMSLFEQYTMNIPLFFPSIELLTEWNLKYSLLAERTWTKTITGVSKNRSNIPIYNSSWNIPDPNNDLDYSAMFYWLKYADFYQWPYITYFNSIDDLILKLKTTNLANISKQMTEYNHKRKADVIKQWNIILSRISTSS